MAAELIICTEKGNLESMSKLLVWSIRKFGGRFGEIPIYSYQPRKGFNISKETISFFEKYEVTYIDEELNRDYIYYPLANKPFACAHRERHTTAEHLIFMDSDILFLKEPMDLLDFGGSDVILRPVDYKNIGIESSDDVNAGYWEELYHLLDVKIRRKVRSTGGSEEILEYYNSGHIVTKKTTACLTTGGRTSSKRCVRI